MYCAYLVAVALCNGKIRPGSLGGSTDSPFCSEYRTKEELATLLACLYSQHEDFMEEF